MRIGSCPARQGEAGVLHKALPLPTKHYDTCKELARAGEPGAGCKCSFQDGCERERGLIWLGRRRNVSREGSASLGEKLGGWACLSSCVTQPKVKMPLPEKCVLVFHSTYGCSTREGIKTWWPCQLNEVPGPLGMCVSLQRGSQEKNWDGWVLLPLNVKYILNCSPNKHHLFGPQFVTHNLLWAAFPLCASPKCHDWF